LSVTGKRPLYLIDENISYKFAIPFKALGYEMTSVEEVWPKKELIANGKKNVEDPEIIDWLGKQ